MGNRLFMLCAVAAAAMLLPGCAVQEEEEDITRIKPE